MPAAAAAAAAAARLPASRGPSPACAPAHKPPPSVLPQAEHVAVLRSFPPSSLQELAAQRDVLVAYAAASPLAVAAGYCGAYILMQVGALWW